jgi:hypothetical protein
MSEKPKSALRQRQGWESVTIDKLAAWLNALGCMVEIGVRPYDHAAKTGQFIVAV